MSAKQHKILIVDDMPKNIQLLATILSLNGYEVEYVLSGSMAIEIVKVIDFDLILMDVMMPAMDGFETCQKIKSIKGMEHIPIIFITAKIDMESIKQGFDLGGVDYITKPFIKQELLARISTHLRVGGYIKKIEEQNREIIMANRMKDDIENIVKHDIKSPLTPIINYPDLLIDTEKISEKGVLNLNQIKKSGERILNIINSSLRMYEMEKGTYILDAVPLNIFEIISVIKMELNTILTGKELSLDVLIEAKKADITENELILNGDSALFYSVFSNLIKNAFEAAPDQSTVKIEFTSTTKNTEIAIINQGEVPESIRATFFDKYVTSEKKGGMGLGTYSAKLIVESMDGKIVLDSKQGTTKILITIPKN